MPGALRGLAAGALALALAGCPPARTLTVDVRSDLVPERELGFVRIVVRGNGRSILEQSHVPRLSDAPAYLRGRRFPPFEALPEGIYTVEVFAHAPPRVGRPPETGSELFERPRRVLVRLAGDRVLPITLGSICAGVTCPGPGDDRSRTECVNGCCVEEACDSSDPDARALCVSRSGCSPECETASDCTRRPPSCAEWSCMSGACVAVDRPGACPEEHYCDRLADACLPVTPVRPVDAGLPDAGHPSDAGPADARTDAPGCRAEVCDNGTDDDCDGRSDCLDDDCIGAACDDGDLCTHTDRCTGSVPVTCAGTPISCASSDCVDRACNGTAACTEVSREHQRCGDRTNARLHCCGGACVDIYTDTRHCGGCGIACAPGRACGGRGFLASCTCGVNAECPTTRVCSTLSNVCSCDPAFGGVCPYFCFDLSGGADICTYNPL